MLLQLGDKGDNVKYLQYGLHILCCSPNGFDGEFGNGTLTAVKKFQSKYGLVNDGIVGDVTWNTLKNEIATIQAQLNKKGCSVGTVDGIAGPATYNAVISFQNKNGLTADGQVGTATWDILFDTVSGGTTYTRILKVTSPLMYGEDIKAVQNKLNSLGYNCGTADGYYGNATKSAVISFQSAKGLTADGEVGPATWNALFSSSSTSTGSSYTRLLKVTSPLMYGEDIKAVQNKLNSLGHNCGTADGYYGNATKSAVVSFQSAKGIDTDGVVGPTTWNALSSSSSGSGTLPGGPIKVFIDAGHGDTDPGAVGNGLKEKNIVLNIATKLGALLNGREISIKYSRTNDTYLSLEDRARLANAWGADLFVSIHANSATSSVRGTECYTHPTANTATKTLSANISRSIASKFGIPNRGHKEANFAVLRLSNMPAILVETAFISNSSDANLLNTRQDDFANAIFNEILNYFNMSISTSTILDQINNSGFAELFGVKFTQTLQEKIIAQAGPIKVKLSLTRGGSNNGEIVANFKNGSFDSGTFKNDLLDLSTTLSKNGVNISKQLLKLGNKSFSISVSTNNNIITVSLTKTLNINDSTFSQVLSIEYDKDGLKDIYENITVVVNSLVEKSKPILLPLLLIGALIIFIKLGFLSALISFGAALLTQLGYAIYTMITFIATN